MSRVVSHVMVISDVHGYQSCSWLSVMSRAIGDVHSYQSCPGLSMMSMVISQVQGYRRFCISFTGGDWILECNGIMSRVNSHVHG